MPKVQDIAHEIQGVGLVVAEEVEEELGLAASGPEVDVRDPDRAVPRRLAGRLHDYRIDEPAAARHEIGLTSG
jgi:hypothetical protein